MGIDPYGSNACGSKPPCVSYLNPNAFALPAQGTYGNMGKGALRGPNLIDYDGALSKEMRIEGSVLNVLMALRVSARAARARQDTRVTTM